MQTVHGRRAAMAAVFLAGAMAWAPRVGAQITTPPWIQPTQEELTMTSQAGAPGADAVYLNWDEFTDDELNMKSIYVRIKVLSEAGRDRGNVVLTGRKVQSDDYLSDANFENITDLAGRTIHGDGTVIPFTGKPQKRTVEKFKAYVVHNMASVQETETVMSLPDVEVGSILEYRYKVRIPEYTVKVPTWHIQKNLYVRSEHFSWKSTTTPLQDMLTQRISSGMQWTAFLPPNTQLQHWPTPGLVTKLQGMGQALPFVTYDLAAKDVPPLPKEDQMPPMKSLGYRVDFYPAYDSSQEEYWKNEGKAWSRWQENFLSPAGMADALQTVTTDNAPASDKLHKIYAAVMQMDNTDFTRPHTRLEDKVVGLKDAKSVKDIWERKRGTGDELTLLFVALARAAGLKASVMRVTGRDTNLFIPQWLTLSQLEDNIAIVDVDGKEQFFDPGQRYCPYGLLVWKHTGVGGLREVEKGTALAQTPMPPYMQTQTQRIGDLVVDANGDAQGILIVKWMGEAAIPWRQMMATHDEDEVHRALADWVKERIPAGMHVEVSDVKGLPDYEEPLEADLKVAGPLASVTDKRLMLPGAFFEAGSKALFPEPSRTVPIQFDYAGRVMDAVRIRFPQEMKLESVPQQDNLPLLKLGMYRIFSETQGNTITLRRLFDLGTPFLNASEYGDVHSFFAKMSLDDQQPLVLLKADVAQKIQPSAPTQQH